MLPTAPTREQLQAAYGATVPDLIAPGLRVLLVGINPSLWSGAVGRHFGRPGNRLWRTLHQAGFTERQLDPREPDLLLASGIGVTNLVARSTARADELTDDEIRAGVTPLRELVERWQPGWVAFLGLSAYRTAFGEPKTGVGPRPERFAGAGVWVLPNPSGLNAHYQQPALTQAYAGLRVAVDADPDGGGSAGS